MTTTARLLTVGEIARQLGQPLHRVEYIIRARQLPESGRAGNLRVYETATVDVIRQQLARGGDGLVFMVDRG